MNMTNNDYVYIKKVKNADTPEHKNIQERANILISILKDLQISDSQDDIGTLEFISSGYFNNEEFAQEFIANVEEKYCNSS